MLPNSWDDLFYLMKKEVHSHPDLPNFTIPQLKKIHKMLWVHVKELMRDETSEISLQGFIRLVPKAIRKNYDEKGKTILNHGPSKSKSKSGSRNKESE